jgi:hypothetical protein
LYVFEEMSSFASIQQLILESAAQDDACEW